MTDFPGALGASKASSTLLVLFIRSPGKRLGHPSDASWVCHPKVPMSEATRRRLSLLAERASDGRRKVSPMQIAAQILGDALNGMHEP